MFRRKWTGLPADPDFPADLEALGYFVNPDDEIRSIANNDNYFKFFISRNPRWNDRQRYAMNEACGKIIQSRLQDLGLEKHMLPLGAESSKNKPRLPIFASKSIAGASRVVLIFGESTQDLGVLAHRVIGGPGGINKGSMVSIVQSILSQRASPGDDRPPAVLLANCGQLMWLPSLLKTLSPSAWDATRMKSAVHLGNLYTREVNSVPGNRTVAEHVKYIFEDVLPALLGPDSTARLDVIGVGDGADAVERYLDDDQVWSRLDGRLNCMALVGGLFAIWEVKTAGLKAFLRDRARNYALSMEPLNTPISGPDGNTKTTAFTGLGCPVLSSGEPNYTECTLIRAAGAVLDWIQEVSLCTIVADTATTVPNTSSERGSRAHEEEEDEEVSSNVSNTSMAGSFYESSIDGNSNGGPRGDRDREHLINTYKNPVFDVTYADPDYELRGSDEVETWNGWEGPGDVLVSSLAGLDVADDHDKHASQ
ncbi:uncharacterized protein B0I36DRAFT_358953 [Microdochium trichocladiopsis]|uniref:Arb2 domain-containing protein n=1 Tax=Microdochium trichocladiopsis TaxID=1682393 RepID=A0A9P8YFZ3_9PEZI|nr:uncharacterized protein B0I36DRAFT_358953 [Microdochium trichocladiopsis]KAH7037223.1 hypothetical protein B0I36DRAFT_358953 [Microdochium trichocladiopsis]